jgi:hypothetical protein
MDRVHPNLENSMDTSKLLKENQMMLDMLHKMHDLLKKADAEERNKADNFEVQVSSDFNYW